MRGTLEKVETRQPIMIENCGQQIFGVLHRPLDTAHPPIVVFMHGFASSKHGANRCYVTLAESLAKQGIASLRFDFRGSGDSEGNLSEISFEDLVSDALVVLDSLDIIDGLDCGRLGLFGSSLGGAIAVLAAARFQKVKAITLWAPVASGELWYHDFLMRHPEHRHADPSKILSSYRGIELSEAFRQEFWGMCAYKKVYELQETAFLLMHGEKDETVSIAHFEAYKKACIDAQLPSRFVTSPDGQHSLGFSSHFPLLLQEATHWFEKYL